MSTFAVVKDGVVVNTVVADTAEIVVSVCSREYGVTISAHECVGENALVSIGWSYDGTNFSAPVEEVTE